MTRGSTRALIASARERVQGHRAFKRTYPARNSLTELYDEHERLADTLETLTSDMHEREMHHFETEQENARLRGVIQAAYDAWHMESRQSAIDILFRELGSDPFEAAP